MLKIISFMLLLSVALFAEAHENDEGAEAHFEKEPQKDALEVYNESDEKNEENNSKEKEEKKCEGEERSERSAAENNLERLNKVVEYEIVGYIYPPMQPYYYEIPVVYEK